MRAIVKEQQGVSLKELPAPVPKCGEVLIQVKAAAYCRSDGYVASGVVLTSYPRVLGHEFSGIVVDSGGDAERKFSAGARVGVIPICTNDRGEAYQGDMLGVERDGCFAELIAVPEELVIALPEGLDFRRGAYLEPVAAALGTVDCLGNGEAAGRILLVGGGAMADLSKLVLEQRGYRETEQRESFELADVAHSAYDVVVLTMCEKQVMEEALRVLRPHGRIIVRTRKPGCLPFRFDALVRKSIQIRSQLYGSFREALELLANERFDIDPLMADPLDFETFTAMLEDPEAISEEKKWFLKPA